MRAFRDVLRFELRLHLQSPLFWGVALLFFVLHLLTLTRTGINLDDNEQIAMNSAWLIFRTELILGLFGMLPAIVFPVTAITRDDDRRMTELFFTTPVPRSAFLLGRFTAGALAACLVGLFGIAGALTGSFMPWIDPSRLAPFDWRPWAASLIVIVLPNIVVFSSLFFSVAALTRSTALTLGTAAGVLALEVLVNVRSVPPVPRWLLLADPFGSLPVAEVARFWTVSELNTRLPVGLLLPNRLLWLALASATLGVLLWRYRLELPAATGMSPAGGLQRRRAGGFFTVGRLPPLFQTGYRACRRCRGSYPHASIAGRRSANSDLRCARTGEEHGRTRSSGSCSRWAG